MEVFYAMGDDLSVIVQEIRERLVKIETLLEQKQLINQEKLNYLEGRIDKLEGNNTWLWRAITGAVISGIVAFLLQLN